MDVSLPKRLEERLRWEVAGGSGPANAAPATAGSETQAGGRYVLYWMHHALRGHENPALDAAICLARQNQLPLLVYQGLCESHRYASDRHHAFVLQGARDVQRELTDRGIRYVFNLQRSGERGPHLKGLARDAAIMVTEETPVEPILGWMERIRASTTIPLLSVDTSCVVPMPTLTRLHTDVTEFRRTTQREFAARVVQTWEDEPVDCPPYRGRLPFEPVDLQDLDLARAIGDCSIDHTIAPVIDTPGGSRAGYARWQASRQQSPPCFSEAVSQGASRMNAYLNYGMVSPLRIARQAHRSGASEVLSRLLLRRELAYHFCFHLRDALETFETLPEWARETMVAHADDPRLADLTWEQLARARTGDRLWDACQRSLLKHGELHPDARKFWGKSILNWTAEPPHALRLAIDLNHRFALDGSDPVSYGGLLWSFGQFDRPLEPERPVLGKLPPAELKEQLEKTCLEKFEAWTDRPVVSRPTRIAVVGAGVAGLVAARTWTDAGLDVTLFDRSHRPGGRMATRRTASGASLDYGAQYFTVRDDRFAHYVRAWIQAGVVASWNGRIVDLDGGKIGEEKADRARYVGVPGMRRVAEHLAADLCLIPETSVAAIEGDSGSWRLRSDEGRPLGEFDIVIAACPPRQAASLLAVNRELAETIRSVPMAPCWAVMVELEHSLELEFDAAFVHHSPLSWIARNNSKPGRAGQETWILHASSDWSRNHLEEVDDEVLVKLLTAFTAATGAHVSNPVSIAAHRWRSAVPLETLDRACLWDPASGLGACGDWCAGPRVEGAFLSGAAMAGAVLRHRTIDRSAPLG